MRVFFISVALVLVACGAPEDKTEAPVQVTEQAPPKAIDARPKLSSKLSTKANGKKFYKKCIACHLGDGVGISGSFPSLNTEIDMLAMSEAGRTYLVLVIYNGLRGKLETRDGTYNGTMVRQASGKSPQDVADVLNYILGNFYEAQNYKVFTAEEVQNIKDTHGKLGGDKVLALRPKIKG